MTVRFYSERFKHKVCQEYLQGEQTKSYIQDKYGILGKSALLIWLRKFGYVKYSPKPIKKRVNQDRSELDEVKELQAKLKEAELKAEAYRRMISIAERRHKIDIIKKNDTK